MNTLPLLIAWRYIAGARHEKNISIMVKICFLGIAIGSFSLALVMAIMNGFEKATHDTMQGIHAQISMRSYGQPLAVDAISAVLHREFPQVAAFSPTSLRQAIIQRQDADDSTNLVILKAIDPAKEAAVTALDSKITQSISKDKSLVATVHDTTILIGKKLAEHLHLAIGDTITILFNTDEQVKSRKVTLGTTQATVGGIFSTGIEEVDDGVALVSFALFESIFPDVGITQINIKLRPHADEDDVITALQKRFDLEVYSWKDLYPALVSALKLEKYVMFVILALITLVASMNIISLLFMQITQKRGDIAILKAMGLSDNNISTIFLMMGTSITCCATFVGLALACIASFILEHYPFITLPDAYYVTHLPAKMEWHLLILVFAVIFLLSLVATWFPAYRTRKIRIADVLRFEA